MQRIAVEKDPHVRERLTCERNDTDANRVAWRSPQFFHDVFNASPIGIVVEDLEGQPLFVNPAFCAFLGFTEEELHAKHCVDFSPADDAARGWALFQQLRAGSIDHYQLKKRYFRRDGSLVWGSLSISLLKSQPAPLVIAMVEDITAKKAAEEARFQARRHRPIVGGRDHFQESGGSNYELEWGSGAVVRIYGAGSHRAVDYPHHSTEIMDEENEILGRLRAGGRIEHYETQRLTKTGTLVDVSLIIGPIKDSTGRVVGFTKIAHNITNRKHAEQVVKESEARFRLVADTAPVLIWMSGADKLCTYFNSPWLEFTGRSTEQELGNGWAEGVHPEDLQRCLDTYTDSFERREKFRMEYWLRRSDGEYRWVLDIGVPRFNEDRSFAGYIGIAVDVTERKITEENLRKLNRTLEAQTAALQSREELLKIFVENVPAGVAMLDCEMRYLQVSQRWCSDYSVERSQVLGRSHYDVFPEVPERWKEVHRRALDGETLRAEDDRWDREGGTTWVRWEVRPWSTSAGSVGGVLIFAEDITRRKQMEEAVSEISRKLIQSQEQERARIGRELHDDINQRLAMLGVELQRLQDDPSEIQKHLRELQQQTAEISNDVQGLSHELHASKLEYLGVVAGIRSWCREFGERHGMEINFRADVTSRIPSKIGVTLFRILQEGLHNAVKHSQIKLIGVQLSEHPNEIVLTVSDAGMGFDVEAARRGTGLGLASMEERARLVNGTLAIESKPMNGTRIHVRVPIQLEGAAIH